MTQTRKLIIKFSEVQPDKHIVSGWASVTSVGGKALLDLHGDIIKGEDLEEAAYKFVASGGQAWESHVIPGVGYIIESIYFSTEKQKSLGIDLGKEGWYCSWKITDMVTWDLIKTGQLNSFSIGIRAKVSKVNVHQDDLHITTA